MRKEIIALTLILATGLSAEQRTITDVQGRSLDVNLLSIDEDSVLVVTANEQEFDIPLSRLSQADREFLSTWTPPELDIPDNPIDSVVIMRSKDESDTGYGSGFFAHDRGKRYIYTNQHVISDILNIEAVDSHGNTVALGQLEVSNSKDLARFRVRNGPALLIEDSVNNGEEVTALGNSEGAGVITSEKGNINGVGPHEVEVSCEFVPGNSGGPVINARNEVIGVATYATFAPEKPEWTIKDTRYEEVRRFTLRPSRVDDWRAIPHQDYATQVRELESAWGRYWYAYYTWFAVSEWDGYLSTIPSHYPRELKMVLSNHNARQRRPDSQNSVQERDGYAVIVTESKKAQKEASRRANLRAIKRYLEELGDLYRLRNNYLDIEFLIDGHDGANDLLDEIRWLKSEIDRQT